MRLKYKQKGKVATLLIILLTGLFSSLARGMYFPSFASSPQISIPQDSIKLRYPIKKDIPSDYADLKQQSALDLKSPANLKSTIEYDSKTGTYVFITRVGDMVVGTPLMMSMQEYGDYELKQSFASYWKLKNADALKKSGDDFSLTDVKINIGPADKIFGPGGVQLKTSGSAELKFGFKTNNVENPSLPEKQRKKTYFDFDEKIDLNMTGKVGDKMSMSMTYNTEASFQMDSKKLKLQYQGKEDEIIKNLEAGNVSMTTGSSLIKGGTALFGVKADMQFGKLKVTTLVSQQQSQTKSVSSSGSVQTTEFEIPVDEYDENRHFFLSHYFRGMYDQWMSKLPYISSGITINRVEVWVTNKRSKYDEARNIVAFVDLGENNAIYNDHWTPQGNITYPYNNANTLYQEIVQDYPNARTISQVNTVLEPLSAFGIEGGDDFEKIESARKLTPSEYTINKQLGYISLNSALQADEVLAVSFEYTRGGQIYQVGEFASDNSSSSNNALYLKLLKGTTLSPRSGCWDLMMKNVYSLGAGVSNIQRDKFRFNIKYLSDSTGVYVNYLPEGNVKNKLLIKVMNLDRLDNSNEINPDGQFDFVEGYTIVASKGRIIFPVTEPFGSYLRKQIGNNTIADKYVYEELYDSTLTIARQIAEKNKFLIQGEYKGKSGAVISLGAMNVPRGSVTVTAGGQVLTEGSDYSVDYAMGEVTILNQSIAESGKQVSVSLEDQTMFSMQRKTMLGVDMNYTFNENFSLGVTAINLSEKPLTTKVSMGDESISNTIWGMNTSYKKKSQWLTNMVDKLPFLNLTEPSLITFNGEFANLIPGNSINGKSYIDDFETAKNGINILQPYAWMLASVPFDNTASALFPEAQYSNDTRYGMNRALLAWYTIDPLFTRKRSSLTPSHIKNDLDQLSNHYIREVNEREIYPNKDQISGQTTTLSTLNLAFYPQIRGPYNLDVDGMGTDGNLINPQKRWGGITRKLDNTDFESANVEYIEFWLMDPFAYDTASNASGGDLYFNLGEISEDVLKDGKKYFENGLPSDRDPALMSKTVWGYVPTRQSTVYAFDNSTGGRSMQDVGLNGLSTKEELAFPTYSEYVNKLRAKLSPATLEKFALDEFSPLNDPAGDKYHYYRGSDYDRDKVDVLSRYKRYNGTEGNSIVSTESPESYDVSARTTPDVEDINQDNTLNEYEKYYQYHVQIKPDKMDVGENYIENKRTATIQLRNGKTSSITWYQFKIPITDFEKKVGSINDFKTIRFIRMFLTNFKQEVVLRFGTLELVRGDWRRYEQSMLPPNVTSISNGTMDVATVNIEENGTKTPVNYVLPPYVSRSIDPDQSQIRQQNEQALSIKVSDLSPNDARAVYKKTNMDLRQYRRLQMYVHGEKFINDNTNLKDGEMTAFIRIGTDYKNNYYEYEVPLTLTPEGVYNRDRLSDQLLVWPDANMIDFPFELLTQLKLERNREQRSGSSINYMKAYSGYDPEKPMNRVTVMGNPSISEVKTIMIGVRNNGRQVKSAEVWFNELRLTDFNEDGGWAARGNLSVQVSDFGTVSVGAHTETAGFGSVDQSVSERRLDDYFQYDIATSFELGKFFPEKAKVSVPFNYSVSNQTITPKYNPLDQDVLLKDALDKASNQSEKDSIQNIAVEESKTTSFSLSNIRVNVSGKTPKPWDPSNFSAGYFFSETQKKEATVSWETSKDYRGNLGYSYAPYFKPLTPFSKVKPKSLGLLKDMSISYLPTSLMVSTDMSRHYYEMQLRDVENNSGAQIPLSFSKDFLWNRDYTINWDLTKNISMTFKSGIQAKIDEPNVPVNKKLYPDEYEVWKDSIRYSLLHFGRPMTFDQSFDLTYNIPINKIPLFDWVTSSSLTYKSFYAWDRGSYVDDTTNLGNTIQNEGDLQLKAGISFEKIYDKIPFLAEANKRFSVKPQTLDRRADAKKKEEAKVKQKKSTFEKIITLNDSTPVRISHMLDKKDVIASAKTMNGKKYDLKFKKVDHVSLDIENLDTIQIKVTVIIPGEEKESSWKKFAYGAARALMSLRSSDINYGETNGTVLPGFMPETGEFTGQDNSYSSSAPGYGFTFGLYDPDFVKKAARNGWLIGDSSISSLATVTSRKNLQYTIKIEPIRSLKIDLTSRWQKSNTSQIDYMYAGMPETFTGTFQMTTIAISSAFENTNANNNYESKAFTKFQTNRQKIADRIQQKYVGTKYPTTGFMSGNTMAGQLFDPSVAGVNSNSTDVLVAAFLSAYTGKDANSSSLNPFPAMLSALPNWKVTYDGLSSMPVLRSWLKVLTLSHAYTCSYNVSSYSSYSSWIGSGTGSDLGYVSDVATGLPVPSSPYDITSVSLNESFSPLFGVSTTWQNNITAGFDVNRTRNMSLNISAYQIVESRSNDYKITLGYKFTNFSKVLGLSTSGAGANNDLKVDASFTLRNQSALLRKIEDNYTQATNGNQNVVLGISADYIFSRTLTIRAYYDRQMNRPLISSSAYPVTSSAFGVSLQFSLNR